MRIVVFGMGYVGCVSAACLADDGHGVTGVDLDDAKVAMIESGHSPIIEPKLDDIVAAARESGRLRATSDGREAFAECDLAIVCVGTPSQPSGALDLSHVERVAEELGSSLAKLDGFRVVAFRSTMLPGSVEGVLIPTLERASGKRAGVDFGVAFCPEFLREASGVDDFLDPPMTVVGVSDDRTADVLREIFSFTDRPFHVVSFATAEALKYSCNAFHAVKITFANEIGRLCQQVGADARDVMRIFCDDDRLNLSSAYLRPGFAYGGSCLPKDLRALVQRARNLDVDIPMLASLSWSNESLVRQATRLALRDDSARRVALMGLSFKPGTDDLRESPFVELAETLIGKGLDVRIYDRNVNPTMLRGANKRFVEERLPHLHRVLSSDPVAALAGVDCAFVSTNEPAVVEAVLASPPRYVVDLCGTLGASIESLPGYAGISW
jgi:GDP-mannose 6-dehydrogenase